MAIEKKIILITGANNGLGLGTAFAIANASPTHHVIMGSRSLAKGQAALESLQARQPAGTLSLAELDVTSDATIAALAKTIETQFAGRLDVLINNAAVADPYPLTNSSPPPADRASLLSGFDTNAAGPYLLFQALEPFLRRSADPRVINVSSGLGSLNFRAQHDRPDAHIIYDAYRLSKAALNMATLSLDYRHRGWLKVWAFCPGLNVTDLTGAGDHELRTRMGARHPEETGAVILDVVNGKRDADTGKFINVEGGTYPW